MNFMLFLALAAMGCTGEGQNNDSDTSVGVDPDDTSDPENYVTVDVTIHAAIDGVPIDPVGVCIHEATDDVGNEDILAQAEVTGKAIPVTVLKNGEMVRPWIGPATSSTTSDGYRILEFNGMHYVSPLADFMVSAEGCGGTDETAKMVSPDYCEPTVAMNAMPALEDTEYTCVGQQWWTESGKELSNSPHNFTQKFVASEGQYFADPDEMGFDGLFGTNESLMTKGTALWIHNSTTGDYAAAPESAVTENGFTFVDSNADITTHLTCTK